MEIPDAGVAIALRTATSLRCDVAVVGGGTAGTMAAITAAEHGASVLLLEKAHVRHSGALAMGMDGVNNAVIPGRATPEDYVAEITRANDGVVNQETVWQTATRGYEMVRRLERYGVKFAKDLRGEYDVRRVHRSGSYVLPMPEGKDIKKVLYRVLRQRSVRERVRIENRVMPVRVLTGADGRACGLAGFNTRTGEFVTVAAGAVILATGACGRLGLPASGYLYGTYENPTNAGDGHAMAYHAGAELSGLECFQINPLIKDYNGPACAYVANPFGGYQVNHHGERFVDCDYWSGQMMAEVTREISSARGPIYLKLTHLPSPVLAELESILHTTERPTRGTFHTGRQHDYRTHDVEMHISEIGLCGGHSSSGVWVDANARTTVPGLYAAGDLACVPHNYMIGAFVFGDLAGADAARSGQPAPESLPADQVAAARELIYRPLHRPHGPPQAQVEYKLRRFVNDYVAPPKTEAKLMIALETFARMEQEIAAMGARTPHELMRCAEVTFIRDCAELAARASLVRAESRWGLYHQRADLPGRDDTAWFWHLNVRRSAPGTPEFVKRAVAPYLVPVAEFTVPDRDVTEVVLGEPIGAAGPSLTARGVPPAATPDRAPAAPRGLGAPARLPELLRLAETGVSLAGLRPFLEDPDPRVRRAAVGILAESAPAGAGAALAGAALDSHGTVRHAAAAALRELAMVLPSSDAALLDGLRQAAAGSDPVVRCAALDALREMNTGDQKGGTPDQKGGTGDHAMYSAALGDTDHRVRLSAVRGLARLGAVPAVADAAGDPSQQVRIGVAEALAAIGDPSAGTAVRQLAADRDPHVRAAAFTAAAAIGCPPPLDDMALAALRDQAWQVRAGAAQALGTAPPGVSHPALATALGATAADPHPDVRKAAVISVTALEPSPDVLDILRAATDDSDADVRAYARRALAGQQASRAG